MADSKPKSIQEWFAEGQRVRCQFFSSLLDAEGRTENVSCHLIEPVTHKQTESVKSGAASETDRAASPAPTSTSIGSFRRRSTRTDAECITFLHGYPTSSYDYYQVVQRLLKQTDFKAKLLLIDMLGYGDSDKGVGQARFSIQQHANVVCSIWQRYDIKSTHLVVHDFSVSVAQELLYREPKRRLPVQLHKIFFLNGSVFIDLYRPTFLQKLCNALPTPQPTWMLSQLLDQAVTDSFSKQHPPSKQLLKDVQQALFNRGGAQIHHKLVRFMKDRARYKYIWQGALELAMRHEPERMMFYWGMQDPLSGAHVAAEIHKRYDQYGVRIEERRDIGHFPHLEDPRGVADALIEFLSEPWQPRRSPWLLDDEDWSHHSRVSKHAVLVRNGSVSHSDGQQASKRRSMQQQHPGAPDPAALAKGIQVLAQTLAEPGTAAAAATDAKSSAQSTPNNGLASPPAETAAAAPAAAAATPAAN